MTARAALAALALAATLPCSAEAQRAIPLSHGWYRIGYDNGTQVRVSNDHIDHDPPTKIDMVGQPFNAGHVIVAAADGRVRWVDDSNSACCNVDGCSTCNNEVWIEHNNGEWTKYTHFVQNSVIVAVNQCVSAGDILGLEGDVGHTSGGGSNRAQVPCTAGGVTQGDLTQGAKCGIHLHFEVRATSQTSGLRIPLICGIPGNIYVSGQTYTAGDCKTTTCPAEYLLGSQTIGGSSIRVFQASNRVQATGVVIDDTASVAMFGGNRVTLKPGFRAISNTYFRASTSVCQDNLNGCPPI